MLSNILNIFFKIVNNIIKIFKELLWGCKDDAINTAHTVKHTLLTIKKKKAYAFFRSLQRIGCRSWELGLDSEIPPFPR